MYRGHERSDENAPGPLCRTLAVIGQRRRAYRERDCTPHSKCSKCTEARTTPGRWDDDIALPGRRDDTPHDTIRPYPEAGVSVLQVGLDIARSNSNSTYN